MQLKASDLFNPDVLVHEEKQHALLAHLRQHDPRPIIDDPTGRFSAVRAITRFHDVLEIEKHPDIFTNTPNPIHVPKEAVEEALQKFGRPFAIETLLHMDPPRHTLFRQLTQAWFNPGSVKKLSDTIRLIAKEHIDEIARRGECDFVRDVTTWYPLHVIMLILGMPRKDEEFVMRMSKQMISPLDPDTLAGREKINVLEEFMVMAQYLGDLDEEKRKNPKDDLASVIANAKLDGQDLGFDLRLAYYTLIIIAGHDTTKYASSGGMLALLQHPEQLEKLRRKPELMPLAVEEMIRWAAPVRHFMRTAQQDYQLGDTLIKKGEWLMLLYHSASRDTSAIPDADKFLIDREPNRHLAFGHGVHVCLGQHLARLEMRILFEEMLSRFSTIELAGTPEGVLSRFVAGIKKLPIRYR